MKSFLLAALLFVGLSTILPAQTSDSVQRPALNTIIKVPGMKWKFKCTVDPMTDEPTCAMLDRQLIFARTSQEYLIGFVNNYYPGSTLTIRIDSLTPQSINGRLLPLSDESVNDLRTATLLRVRYKTWPNSGYTDFSWPLVGFSAALDQLNQFYEALQQK